MTNIEQEELHLTGIVLGHKTFNADNQSAIDCGQLWQEFERRKIAGQIPDKLGSEIYAVYYNYEGDHTKPYSYFIGCRVQQGMVTPAGLDSLNIPKGTYHRMVAKGKMPDCVAFSWRRIWNADYPRAYRYDFEVYDERSRDWQNAEVDIFLSVLREGQ